MRLTNHHRSDVVERAVSAAFDPQKEALERAEHDLGMRFYHEVIPEAERRAAKKLSRRWVARDKRLRFSCAGSYLQFDVREEVVVPANSGSCRFLGALGEESSQAAIAHHDALGELRDKRRGAARQLGSLLDSVSTLKQLEEVWPEGRPYYQHLGSDVRLPVPIVRDVNALLGLQAAA